MFSPLLSSPCFPSPAPCYPPHSLPPFSLFNFKFSPPIPPSSPFLNLPAAHWLSGRTSPLHGDGGIRARLALCMSEGRG
eukprot:765718-Hanusia_phi.AAC.2